ncbi:hypothetical protein Y033_4709 [Burkholderia pseudomallei MSHR435]|nr:hypothetical protein Y034_5360 [Burkholderia pseudomallei MSHR449]KGX75003.1 hypothetical protein Y033_4709 [Burkholderia pseudomallei MSHR435]
MHQLSQHQELPSDCLRVMDRTLNVSCPIGHDSNICLTHRATGLIFGHRFRTSMEGA